MPVLQFALFQNGDLVSSSLDNSVKIWNPTNGTLIKSINGFNRIVVLKNGDLICASIWGGNLTVWDTNIWTIKRVLVGFSTNLFIQFSNSDLALIKGPYIFILVFFLIFGK